MVAGGTQRTPRTVAARVLAILGSFSPGHTDLTLAQISRRTGLAASTTHRLVGELQAWGALERDADLRYRIGRRLRELAALSPAAGRLRDNVVDRGPSRPGLEGGTAGGVRPDCEPATNLNSTGRRGQRGSDG